MQPIGESESGSGCEDQGTLAASAAAAVNGTDQSRSRIVKRAGRGRGLLLIVIA